MNRAHYETEKLRLARETQLRIVAEALGNADPDYVLQATGFWLERWAGRRRASWGSRKFQPSCGRQVTI
jgi:hypothetical protein